MNNNLLFLDVLLEADVTCLNCKEELKHRFDNDENQKSIYQCSCGKCILKVSPRKRTYVVYGDYVDNSVSVLEPMFKAYKGWRD